MTSIERSADNLYSVSNKASTYAARSSQVAGQSIMSWRLYRLESSSRGR